MIDQQIAPARWCPAAVDRQDFPWCSRRCDDTRHLRPVVNARTELGPPVRQAEMSNEVEASGNKQSCTAAYFFQDDEQDVWLDAFLNDTEPVVKPEQPWLSLRYLRQFILRQRRVSRWSSNT